jgi:hypothetical protein
MIIKGTLEYEIVIHENGDNEIEYNSNTENELASLCIAKQTIDSYTEYLNEERKKHSGENKRAITNVLNDVQNAKLSLNHLYSFMLNNYKAYKIHEEMTLKGQSPPELKVTQEPITTADIEMLKEKGVIK